ncbi:MAG: hypothetical protein SynsKO_35320 [Synoicihabitans sp.]
MAHRRRLNKVKEMGRTECECAALGPQGQPIPLSPPFRIQNYDLRIRIKVKTRERIDVERDENPLGVRPFAWLIDDD